MFGKEKKKQFLGLLVEEILRLINAFCQVGRVENSALCWIVPRVYYWKKLLEDNEKQPLDIIPVFWERMAIFTETETLGLIIPGSKFLLWKVLAKSAGLL